MLQAERLIKRKVTKGRRGSKPGSKNLTRSKRAGAKYKEQIHKNKQTADWKGSGKRLTRLWWNQSVWDRQFLKGKPKRGNTRSTKQKYKLQIQNQSTRNKEVDTTTQEKTTQSMTQLLSGWEPLQNFYLRHKHRQSRKCHRYFTWLFY